MSTSLTTARVSVSGTATKVLSANIYSKFREIRNLDASNDLAWGSASSVTFATGHILKANEAFTMAGREQMFDGDIYIISGGSAVNISAIEY